MNMFRLAADEFCFIAFIAVNMVFILFKAAYKLFFIALIGMFVFLLTAFRLVSHCNTNAVK